MNLQGIIKRLVRKSLGEIEESETDFKNRLLLHLGAALAYLQTWIALTNHVDTSTALNDFTVFATIFQASNRTYYFHCSSPLCLAARKDVWLLGF